jgi:hypothetical protein
MPCVLCPDYSSPTPPVRVTPPVDVSPTPPVERTYPSRGGALPLPPKGAYPPLTTNKASLRLRQRDVHVKTSIDRLAASGLISSPPLRDSYKDSTGRMATHPPNPPESPRIPPTEGKGMEWIWNGREWMGKKILRRLRLRHHQNLPAHACLKTGFYQKHGVSGLWVFGFHRHQLGNNHKRIIKAKARPSLWCAILADMHGLTQRFAQCLVCYALITPALPLPSE